MSYESLDIFNYIEEKLKIQKTRKRVYLEKRNYLIYILYHKFFYTEEVLAEYFQIDHSSINYVKRTFNDLLTFPTSGFKENLKELFILFPIDFEHRIVTNKIKLKSHINIKNIGVLQKFREYCEITETQPTEVIDGLLDKVLTAELKKLKVKQKKENNG